MLFYVDLLYLDNQQFLANLFDLYVSPISFEVLVLFVGFACFKIFWNTFLKKYCFSALFLLIFVVKFSFLKSVESISVLKIS